MKLASFSTAGNSPRVGVINDVGFMDLALAQTAYRAAHGQTPDNGWTPPPDMRAFIEGGSANLQAAARLVAFAIQHPSADFIFPFGRVRFHAPIPEPYMLGEIETNSLAQFEQRRWAPRAYPAMMILPDNVINDPGTTIILPSWAEHVQVSAQLAFVCGRFVADITSAKAEDAIFGYTLSLCLSTSGLVELLRNPNERDISVNQDYGHWFDGFRPFGPFIVTGDEFDLSLPRSLCLTVGSQKQISNTRAMLYSPARVLSTLAEHIPFYPGDIVGLGAMGRDVDLPAELPTDGLEIAVEVEGLGKLRTIVRRE